uniref:Uncharacterized protein n=1 Tax=Tetradesmus obliquus TaxID=3088 RepID=A0A383WFJ7_TETOB|eukprot:jgi/Sobl393_1/864/SZX75526.1
MSAQKLKATVGQLERKRTKRQYVVRRLQEEQDQLLLHSKAIDLLVQHQDTMARMLHRYYQPCSSPPSSLADDTGLRRPLLFQDWPMMAGLKAMQLADYNWLFGVTPQQVGACVIHYLEQIAVVINRHKASSSSSSSSSSSLGRHQQADMEKAVGDLLFLTKAIYVLTPGLLNDLKDINLLTGKLEPPPHSEWQQ